MSGTAGRPTTTVRLARDAFDFIERVEVEARRCGSDALGLHHWVVVACSRPFLARTIAREADVRSAEAASRAALEVGERGQALPPEVILARAHETAQIRGDSRVHAWHLVLAVLNRVGIATRDGEGAAPDGEGATPDVAPRPVSAAPGGADTAPTEGRTWSVAVPAEGEPGHGAAEAKPLRRSPRRTGAVRLPPTPMLDACGADWTVAAARGELPPMVCRDEEMRLLVESLCRPTKPNVLLVGEPGVGKSALVEGLAQRIAAGDVPAALAGRPLIALSMAEVTRDSRYYGAMEARMATLIAEARAVRAILFIDEGHAMTGAGGRDGTGDVASILKPVLARGDLSIISATTEDEYRRFIAPNGALERRFNVVHVSEPGRAAVRGMLAAHRDTIASAHGVTVDDDALDRLLLATAVGASHRREPDRSRDLLDQAVARAIAGGARRVTTADIEATAASLSGDPDVSDEVLAALEGELVRRGLLRAADARALVDRLGTAFAGLAMRPQRPRASLLVLRTPDGPDGPAIAETLATHVFGGPERVVAITVGGITEPSAISGFLGTTQGYVGHGSTLPVHALAERPHSVLLLRGVDAAHNAFRDLLARALRDGYLTDAEARRIGLSRAIVVLEATAPERAERPLGFAPAISGGPVGTRRDGTGPGAASVLAVAAVGDELAGECDLACVPPEGAGDRTGWVAHTLGRLAASYRAAGVELAWDAEVEAYLAADLGAATARERERAVEARVGRAVRPCLRGGPRPVRARVRGGPEGLVALRES